MSGVEPLAALSELERRFDGPIPRRLRLSARLGGPQQVELLVAEGQTAFFRQMIAGQIATIRQRRRNGSFYPALVADLALYRERWRHWRRRVAKLRGGASDPAARRLAAEGGAGLTTNQLWSLPKN